jgi:DNA repair protein RadA/Sms
MAKPKKQYVCQSCGGVQSKWIGQCPDCQEWDTIVEEAPREFIPKGLTVVSNRKLEFETLNANFQNEPRRTTGISELDRVLGGGLVEGSAILLGGDPGIGKSTILLQLAANLARAGANVAYISGEESTHQLQLRANRLGLSDAPMQLASATNVGDIVSSFDTANAADVLVIDSVQTMYLENIDSAPGTVAQVRSSSFELIRLAKKRGIVLFLVGHVTKEGQIAGPKVLEHMVDTVLYFEGDRGHQFRILRAVKNRFGGTDEIGVFEMRSDGLNEVTNPSSIFLSDSAEQVSGSAVFAGIEGTRPLLVEVQALVADSYMAAPRRAVVGWDLNRLNMILAVMDARANLKFGDKEVYLNIAGGLKISEPAADLAVAAALASSFSKKTLPPKSIYFGEVGLSGEIRPVPQTEARLKEAAKLGFEVAFIPKQKKPIKISGINIIELGKLSDFVDNL